MGISAYELLNFGANMGPYIEVLNSNKDGEIINWYINDQSLGFDHSYVQYMVDTVDRLDDIIDLDFNLVSDILYSGIDVNLYDYGGQDYMGLAYLESDYNYNTWTVLNVVDFSYWGESENSNKNTFIHEFGHALGLAEPGFDNRWDQDDTAMSYNEGDIGWRTWYAESDLKALISVWGAEDDHDIYAGNIPRKGTNENDNIEGSIAGDTVTALRGSDRVQSGEGNDVVFGNQGEDFLYGNKGDDLIYGGKDADVIYGNQGEDFLYGNKGDDLIYGGKSNDWLHGGQGDDVLYGNLDADVFNLSAGSDRVMDFEANEGDLIAIRPGIAYSLEAQGSDLLINSDIGSLLLLGTDISSFYSAQSIVVV